MSVEAVFQCDGCELTAVGAVRSEFVSVSGRNYGFGSRVEQKVSEVAPSGWIAFDPYTGCTYCPTCWTGITAEQEHESHTGK